MAQQSKIPPRRKWRDPSQLTLYEACILEYMRQGMSLRQVTDALGGERSIDSVRTTIRVVKEKLVACEIDYEDPRTVD